MHLREEIEKHNRNFMRNYRNNLRDLLADALDEGREYLFDDDELRMAISIGESESYATNAGEMIATCYQSADTGFVINYAHFLDEVYHKMVTRAGIFSAREKERLAELESELDRSKEQLKGLTQSTASSLEEIMDSDGDIIDAKSRREVDKRSFTNIRTMIQKQEMTNKQLEELSRSKGVDMKEVYGSLEKLRLRIQAQQRKQDERIERVYEKINEYVEDFLDALETPLAASATLGYAQLPKADKLSDLPITGHREVEELVYYLLAADQTLLPQQDDAERDAWELPKVVLIPCTGFVASGGTIATERFKENIIFVPIRCLEDLTIGFIRELLKLRRKMNSRVLGALRDDFNSYLKQAGMTGISSYETMYEKFALFAIGHPTSSKHMGPEEQKILVEHFLPRYTRDLFTPPDLRCLLRDLTIGRDKGRKRFNDALRVNHDSPFIAGTLYADRTIKYQGWIEESCSAGRKQNPAELEEALASRAKNSANAKRLYHRSIKEGDNPRFSFYNSALLLFADTRYQEVEGHKARLQAAALFRKSTENAPIDLWRYKALNFANILDEELAELEPSPANTEPVAEKKTATPQPPPQTQKRKKASPERPPAPTPPAHEKADDTSSGSWDKMVKWVRQPFGPGGLYRKKK